MLRSNSANSIRPSNHFFIGSELFYRAVSYTRIGPKYGNPSSKRYDRRNGIQLSAVFGVDAGPYDLTDGLTVSQMAECAPGRPFDVASQYNLVLEFQQDEFAWHPLWGDSYLQMNSARQGPRGN